MKLKLSDWLSIRWGTDQCIDVIAQLLQLPHQEIGRCLNPDAFYLEFPDDDPSFGELKQDYAADDFAPGFKPVNPQGTEADDVFLIGVMLYRLLTGRLPELGMAQFLMVKVHDQQQVPLLHLPNSVMDPLIARMTDLNPATRISRKEALDQLAGIWKGSAEIRIIEADTGAELECIEVPLKLSETVWQCAFRLQYADQTFVPETNTVMHLPFRVRKVSYPVRVLAQCEPLPVCNGLRLRGFGLDVGTERFRLIRLSDDGRRERLRSIPPIAAFRTREEMVFGEEAQNLEADGRAETVSCTVAYANLNKPVQLLAADGASVQITPRAVAEALMEHMFWQAQKMGMLASEPITLTMPAGWDAALRGFWSHAAQRAGFQSLCITAPAAALLCQSMYGNASGNVMVIDAGASSVDVSIFACGESFRPQDLTAAAMRQCFSAPGGAEMTELLVRDMLQTLNLHHGLSLYRREDSALNAAQFDHDRALIHKAAEQMKRKLSFAEQADVTLSLHDGSASPKEISFRYTKPQLISLLESVSRSVRQAMQQACADKGQAREMLSMVLVTGGASLCPALRHTVDGFFQKTDCRIVYSDHERAIVRGTAFYTAICGNTASQASTLDALPYDLGIITADNVQQLPVFQVLIKAGTPIWENAFHSLKLTVTEADLNENGACQLRLYTRQHGMEHVRSTLDPEGACIKILGMLLIPLPKGFHLKKDRLEVQITVCPDESIKAQAKLVTSKKPGLFSNKKLGKDNGTFPVEYVALS